MNPPATCHPTIEILEARIAPAAVFTFTDTDGDAVKVTSSKGTNAQLTSAFTLSGVGFGNPTLIDLTLNVGGAFVFEGANISIVAKPGLVGDGFVPVGEISAVGVSLGKITVDGDLGRISAGDILRAVPAAKAIIVASLGTLGTLAGAPDLISNLFGKVGAFTVKGDIANAAVNVTGFGNSGRINALTVTGSLFGNVADSGFLLADSLGKIKIGGDLRGGAGDRSGFISTNFGGIDSLTIGGSIVGGGGRSSGSVALSDGPSRDLGAVKVGQNIKAGNGDLSGRIRAVNIASLTVGGSIVGGVGSNFTLDLLNGQILVSGNLGKVKISGDLAGGVGNKSGFIDVGGTLAGLSIGGSIFGLAGFKAASAGAISIKHDINAGPAAPIMSIQTTGKAASLSVGGSVFGPIGNAVSIDFGGGVGSVTVKGGLTNVILNAGGALPAGTTSAFKSITIGGSVERTTISAGNSFASEVQIGSVKVGGDWIASNLLCGVDKGLDGKFGTGDDQLASGAPINTGTIAKIASITIKRQAHGSIAGGDTFGIVAEELGKLSIGGKTYKLVKGPASAADFFALGATGDFKALEVIM